MGKKLTKEHRAVLEGYFKRLGLNRVDRSRLFRYIRCGGNWNVPLMILGEPTTGKTTLTGILRHFGVCVYTPHHCESVTLKKRLALTEEDARYIRDIYDKLGIGENE